MSSTISEKQKQAKAFESILNAESKVLIEKILGSVETSSCYSGNQARLALESILGIDTSGLIVDLMEAYDAESFTHDLKDISRETRDYLHLLYSLFAYKIRGLLNNKLLKSPDSWILVSMVSSKYDIQSREYCLKFAIQKNNKENVIIEDSAINIVMLANFLIRNVSELPSRCPDVQRDLGVSQKVIDDLKLVCERLAESVKGTEKKEKPKNK
jgi:hypothetical protein